MSRWLVVLCVSAWTTSCQRKEESACAELAGLVPPGVVLASEETRCAELLAFAAATELRYRMTFPAWLEVVAGQRVELLLDAVEALSNSPTWAPASFGSEPAHVPCDTGFVVTDSWWAQSALERVLRQKPDRLYVSMGIDVDPQTSTATIRISQDFDCDLTRGLMVTVGQFQRGRSPFAGGWKLLSSTTPELDE